MESRIIGVDVSKDYIITYDGKEFKKFDLSQIEDFVSSVNPGDVVVMEQTGNYSLPWIFNLLSKKTVDIYIAHTTALRRFRDLKGVSKNDAMDSLLLREMFISGNREAFQKFEIDRFWLRFYFFNYRRAVKDFSITVNRLRNFLMLYKPEVANFRTSKKGLEELKKQFEKRKKVDYVAGYVYRLAEKLLLTLEDRKNFESELHKRVVLHKDYELLKTFPHFSDLIIAGLVATYWDIERFKSTRTKTIRGGKVVSVKVKAVDKFRAYLIGSTKRWQSGKMDKQKKIQKRPYILGLLYTVYIQAGKKNSPLYPLWHYVRERYNLLSGYQRYYKFLGYLLGLVYLSVKNRWTFKEVIQHKAKALDGELKEVYNQILERVG